MSEDFSCRAFCGRRAGFVIFSYYVSSLLDEDLLNECLAFYLIIQEYVKYLTKTQYNKIGMKDQGTLLERYVWYFYVDNYCSIQLLSFIGT